GEKCDTPRYKQEDIDNKIIAEIYRIQKEPSIIEDMISDNKQEPFDISAFENQIENLQKKLQKLSNLYMADMVTMDELKKQSTPIQFEISAIKEKIIAETQENSQQLAAENIKNILVQEADIRTMGYDEQKKIVNLLIEKVEVSIDDVRIYWAF
ncbi:MAG: FlxA-like family protein, partial [Streptococcaceae bacterium]|nr:FlxA-like family protein [Streptococcaceae bacterium]